MESYIQISFLNDFTFCPRSIYFHQVYQNFDSRMYQEDVQVRGKLIHKSIDEKKYSTRKNILQGLTVYSDEYSLCGRVDTFDQKNGILTERKKKVQKIYDGYIFQLYAQYYCLMEMGYEVNELYIYSFDDNKKYPVLLPKEDPKLDAKFKSLLNQIHQFNLRDQFHPNVNKCKKCIYRHLCDYGISIC